MNKAWGKESGGHICVQDVVEHLSPSVLAFRPVSPSSCLGLDLAGTVTSLHVERWLSLFLSSGLL